MYTRKQSRCNIVVLLKLKPKGIQVASNISHIHHNISNLKHKSFYSPLLGNQVSYVYSTVTTKVRDKRLPNKHDSIADLYVIIAKFGSVAIPYIRRQMKLKLKL